MSHKGGLLGALLGDQKGGADSYAWHRAPSTDPQHNGLPNARSHLLAAKKLPWETEAKTGESKRAAWIEEVRGVMAETGLNWRGALKEASRRRKQNVNGYQTVVERVKESYTGRNADTVKCNGPKCPGKYNKPVQRGNDGEVKYRPHAHNVSRKHLSTDAATKLLRDYYRQRANSYKNGIKSANKAMRQDISKVNTSRVIQSPCPTKLINVTSKKGKVYQRRVVDKSHPGFAQCRSNWLYRSTPGRFDMEGIDAGDGKDSPAYGKKLERKK